MRGLTSAGLVASKGNVMIKKFLLASSIVILGIGTAGPVFAKGPAPANTTDQTYNPYYCLLYPTAIVCRLHGYAVFTPQGISGLRHDSKIASDPRAVTNSRPTLKTQSATGRRAAGHNQPATQSRISANVSNRTTSGQGEVMASLSHAASNGQRAGGMPGVRSLPSTGGGSRQLPLGGIAGAGLVAGLLGLGILRRKRRFDS